MNRPTLTRFAQVETRLDEHAVKLADVPSTAQIVAAMEQLLSKTMTSLDERLTTQAHSIEALKTTVTQTDSLLERVLESLDSLQTYTDPAGVGRGFSWPSVQQCKPRSIRCSVFRGPASIPLDHNGSDFP